MLEREQCQAVWRAKRLFSIIYSWAQSCGVSSANEPETYIVVDKSVSLPWLLPTGKKKYCNWPQMNATASALVLVMLPTTTDKTFGPEINNQELEIELKHWIETWCWSFEDKGKFCLCFFSQHSFITHPHACLWTYFHLKNMHFRKTFSVRRENVFTILIYES